MASLTLGRVISSPHTPPQEGQGRWQARGGEAARSPLLCRPSREKSQSPLVLLAWTCPRTQQPQVDRQSVPRVCPGPAWPVLTPLCFCLIPFSTRLALGPAAQTGLNYLLISLQRCMAFHPCSASVACTQSGGEDGSIWDIREGQGSLAPGRAGDGTGPGATGCGGSAPRPLRAPQAVAPHRESHHQEPESLPVPCRAGKASRGSVHVDFSTQVSLLHPWDSLQAPLSDCVPWRLARRHPLSCASGSPGTV